MAWKGDGGNYTWRDKAHDEYIRQRNNVLKCQQGNDTYCSYGELHPVETVVGVVGGLATAEALPEIGVIGDFLYTTAGTTCLSSPVCIWLTGMAGGAEVNNALPSNGKFVRIMPEQYGKLIESGMDITLANPARGDVYISASDDIAGLTTSQQIAERLTLVYDDGSLVIENRAVIEFEFSSIKNLASAIGRTDPGFVGYGLTSGGAREWVIPNLPVSQLPINITNIWYIH